MGSIDSIERQLDAAHAAIVARMDRLYEGLHQLAALTTTLFDVTPPDPEAVDRWFEREGFEVDPNGYFERAELLALARSGGHDPDRFLYYVHERFRNDRTVRHRMYAMRKLGPRIRAIRERLGGLEWVYYQDAAGWATSYPMHDPTPVIPADFDWLAYFTHRSVEPSVNPEREIRWTPPNIDYGGKGLMLAASIPLYLDDRFVGLWSMDVPLASILEDARLEASAPDHQVFIVDREGYLVAHPSIETILEETKGAYYRERMAVLGGELGALDLEPLWKTPSTKLEVVDGAGWSRFGYVRPVERIGWLLFATVPAASAVRLLRDRFDAALRRRAGDDAIDRASAEELETIADGFTQMARDLEASLAARERDLEALRASEEYNRQLFDESPLAMAIVRLEDGLRVIDDSNRAFSALVGSSVEGANVGALFVADDAEVDALFDDVEHGSLTPELALRASHGRTAPVRAFTSRVSTDAGPAVLLVLEDLTERRLLEERVLQTQKMNVIGQLAGGVAHDFNNLLTAILSSTYVLKEQVEGDLRELVEIIEMAGDRAAALTAQLLAFSRRELVAPRFLDPREVAGELERLLPRLLDDYVDFELTCADDVPPVRADPTQLVQAIMNLVVNARDALPAQGSIRVTFQREDAALRIDVADTGVGIAEAERERIFESFYTTKSTGTGLGLATVKEIADDLGGSVSIDSELGRGTTVTLHVPAATKAEAEAPATEPCASVEGLAVLVVDDDSMVREAARRSLELIGCRPVTAASGEAALRLLETGAAPDILLSDVVMPRMSGRELAERARALVPDLPVLFMSGYTDDAILRQGIRSSEVRLLRKPFTTVSLREALSAIRPVVPRRALGGV